MKGEVTVACTLRIQVDVAGQDDVEVFADALDGGLLTMDEVSLISRRVTEAVKQAEAEIAAKRAGGSSFPGSLG